MRTTLSFPVSRQLEAFEKLYDVYHSASPCVRHEHNKGLCMTYWNVDIANMLVEHFPPSTYPRVLDGGVGSCEMVRLLSRMDYHAHGHEASRNRILTNCTGIPVSRGLMKATSYEKGYFDLVSSVECIEHIPVEDIATTFHEMGRILRPGGLFVFTLGPCWHICKGLCSWSAIHPSGLCEARPREWWHHQLIEAGFEALNEVLHSKLLKSLNVHETCVVPGTCADTPGFTNGYGYGCAEYFTKRWCENGAAAPEGEWTLGPRYAYPEKNCCVCGKPGDAEADSSMQAAQCKSFNVEAHRYFIYQKAPEGYQNGPESRILTDASLLV